jgi:hypothetical protein
VVADTSWQTVLRAGRNRNRPLDTGAETTHFNRGHALQTAPTGIHVPAGAYLYLPFYWFLRNTLAQLMRFHISGFGRSPIAAHESLEHPNVEE